MPQPLGAPLAGLVRQGEKVTGLGTQNPVGQRRGDPLALRPPVCFIGDEDIRDLVAHLSGAEGRQDAEGGGRGCHAQVQVVLRAGQAGGSYQPGRLRRPLRGTPDHGVALVGGLGVCVVGWLRVGGIQGGRLVRRRGVVRQRWLAAGSCWRWHRPDGLHWGQCSGRLGRGHAWPGLRAQPPPVRRVWGASGGCCPQQPLHRGRGRKGAAPARGPASYDLEAARPSPGSLVPMRPPGCPGALQVARWPHSVAWVARHLRVPQGAPPASPVPGAPG